MLKISDAKRTSCLEQSNYGNKSKARVPLVKGELEQRTDLETKSGQIDSQQKINKFQRFSFFLFNCAQKSKEVVSWYSSCVRWTKFAIKPGEIEREEDQVVGNRQSLLISASSNKCNVNKIKWMVNGYVRNLNKWEAWKQLIYISIGVHKIKRKTWVKFERWINPNLPLNNWYHALVRIRVRQKDMRIRG